jgi:hypothetical protein
MQQTTFNFPNAWVRAAFMYDSIIPKKTLLEKKTSASGSDLLIFQLINDVTVK